MEISADAPVASEIPEGFKRYLCSQCSKPQVTAIDDDSLGGLCMECRRAWHRNKDKKPSAPVEAPAAATPPTTPLSLDLPDECLYGKLGDIARSLQVPLGFAYPCVLTVASCLGVQDIGGNVRSNLYTALIGGIGSGKTVAKDRALQSIFLPDLSFTRTTPGSDRGLIKILGTLGGPMLLVQDELRNLLTKMQTPGSGGSLVAILCDLWSEDIAGAGDKKGVDECDCKLSILGNIPCEDATDFSLVTSWCFERVKEWKGQIKERRRIAEIALRIALIQSACNGEKEVSHESLELALKFGEGQEDIRKVYKAGLSQNPEAECTEAILSVLMQHGVGAKVHWTTMINNKSWYRRFGASMVKRVRDSLEKEGIITVIKEAALDMNGNEVGRPKPTGEVKLQRPIK